MLIVIFKKILVESQLVHAQKSILLLVIYININLFNPNLHLSIDQVYPLLCLNFTCTRKNESPLRIVPIYLPVSPCLRMQTAKFFTQHIYIKRQEVKILLG